MTIGGQLRAIAISVAVAVCCAAPAAARHLTLRALQSAAAWMLSIEMFGVTPALLAQTPVRPPWEAHGALRISPSGHQLVHEDGTPFFWLGDTGWYLFARLSADESRHYFSDRARKRFNVIQASFLAFNLSDTSVAGQTPFMDRDWNRPNPSYWAHVDSVLTLAERAGVYMAVSPAWAGAHIDLRTEARDGRIPLSTDDAYRYARWLGARYGSRKNLIWLLGGDVRPSRHDAHDAIARGLADGAAGGDQRGLLMTYHPPGGTYRPPATSTGEFYHNRGWLDFNMIQSGHRLDNRSYERIAEDYARTPVKPTLDGEPGYEQHPVVHNFQYGVITAWHLRRRGYWSVLAGAFGFTYGANGVWQMDRPGRVFQWSHFNYYWYDALNFEGSLQMTYLRGLFESRPALSPERIPDQRLVASPQGAVDDRVQASRASDGSYAILYITSGDSVHVDLSRLSGTSLVAWWFNPRNGRTYSSAFHTSTVPFARFARAGRRWFHPPGVPGENNDWVLVIDDAARKYRVPGYSPAPAPPASPITQVAPSP